MTRPTPRRSRPGPAAAGVLAVGATLAVLGSGTALAAGNPGSAQRGSSVTSGPAPDVTLTAARSGDTLAPGVGRPGVGSPAGGSGFVINVKTRTSGPGLAVKEGLNIRHTDRLGRVNPDFPGLVVTADSTLTKPDGGLIPAGTNLAPLFNIAGTDDSAGPGVTTWAGWHVLESLAPGTKALTVRASVTDLAGRTGSTVQTYPVSSRAGGSGQALTPPPGTTTTSADHRGPQLSLVGPELPTAVAVGTLPKPTLANGTLFFVQLDALDVARHGIAVNENAGGKGVIVDPTQIKAGGANRNAPGLEFTFNAGLRQPNGNLVPAGHNLAPLFNLAGSTTARTGAVRTTFNWVVGGSLVLPAGQHRLTMTARVTDDAGYRTTTSRTVEISPAISGQQLTPQPNAANSTSVSIDAGTGGQAATAVGGQAQRDLGLGAVAAAGMVLAGLSGRQLRRWATLRR